MRIDGAWADDQGLGDLGIREASCHQPEHFDLALGEAIGRVWRKALVLVRPGLRTSSAGAHWLSLCCDDLLWRHPPPLGPGLGKGLFSELGADCGSHTLVVSMLAKHGKEGEEIEWPHALRRSTERFGGSPELRCPCAIPSTCDHASPLLQKEGHALLVIHLAGQRDTSLAQGASFRP